MKGARKEPLASPVHLPHPSSSCPASSGRCCCPIRPQGPSPSSTKNSLIFTSPCLCYSSVGKVCLPLQAFVDSGAADNLLDLARQLGCTTLPLEKPIQLLALHGRAFATITHWTRPITLVLPGNHCETLPSKSPLLPGCRWFWGTPD